MNELQQKMADAIANNDVKLMETIAGEILKGKTERIRKESEQARKDAEQLAGVREALATEIHKAVRALKLEQKLKDVKSWGFTYKVDKANPNEPDVSYKAVSLAVATVKAKTGVGGGGAGKTKAEFGMSLSEVFNKFATEGDKAKLAEAEAKDSENTAKSGKTTNSNAWRIKNEVKKEALKAGLLAPAK